MPADAQLDDASGIQWASVHFTSAANAEQAFGDIEYTALRTYDYGVMEQRLGADVWDKGIFYSLAAYRVEVTVVDDGSGNLVASSKMIQVNDDSGKVTGSTDPVDGSYTTGNEPTGLFSFGQTTFVADNVGHTFTYEMREVLPAGVIAENGYTVDGMTYDPAVWTIELTIAHAQMSNGATGIAVMRALYKDGVLLDASVPAPTFANTYTVAPSSSSVTDSIIVEKVREVLLADGDAQTAGIQKDGVTYDETVRTVTVMVTDDGQGSLGAVIETADGALTFTNVYVEPVVPGPEDPGTDPGSKPDPKPALPQTGDLLTATMIVLSLAAVGFPTSAPGRPRTGCRPKRSWPNRMPGTGMRWQCLRVRPCGPRGWSRSAA